MESPDPSAQASEDYREAFELLAKMTQSFATAMDVKTTLDAALASMTELLEADEGSLWLVEPESGEVVCAASVGLHPIDGLRLPPGQGIVGRSVRECACQKVLDVAEDPHFSSLADERSGVVTRSLICSPMAFGDEVLGAVEMVNKRSGDGCFSERDAHLLKVLAYSAGLGIANTRLASAKAENERVRHEMELAAEIQRGLLPEARPSPFPVYGINIPARTVSGDFFDIELLERGRIAFCLGDVSGKGMNAALLMAKTASLYRCLVKSIEKPGELLEQLNAEIFETSTRGMFVTMAAGVYDPATGIASIANAGHEPPLHATVCGQFATIAAEAPPLGILEDCDFLQVDLPLEGGSLILCSDGVTEALLDDGSYLGSDGLQNLARRFSDLPLAERIEAIARETGKLRLRDDLTLLGVSDAERLIESDPAMRLCFPASADQLSAVRKAVGECAGAIGFAGEAACDVVAAVDEACQNIIRHAYGEEGMGEIELEIDRDGDHLVILLRDFAPPIDPSRVKPRELSDLRPGGLGTFLMKELMDSVEFIEPAPGCGNLLRMTKRIPGE